MNADAQRLRLDQITSEVIRCAHQVSNSLGTGFLEKVYENALMVELRHAHLDAQQQVPITIRYREEIVGMYFPDILVTESVIVEVKAVSALDMVHRVQCLNYLTATGRSVALLINFGTARLDVRRVVQGF
jgi:GxxExxY protein